MTLENPSVHAIFFSLNKLVFPEIRAEPFYGRVCPTVGRKGPRTAPNVKYPNRSPQKGAYLVHLRG